jgi:drug/metabolite transporter (DMT)-like permease
MTTTAVPLKTSTQLSHRAAAGLGATACLVVGGSVAISESLTDYPVLGGQALRYGAAALLLAIPALLRQRRTPARLTGRDLARLAAVAATGLAGFNICLLEALRHADPAVVGVVVGCSPLLLALGGALTAGRSPSARLLLAAALVAGGAALVQGAGHATAQGLAWSVGALLGEVAFSLLAAPLLPRLGPLRLSAAVCALATPMLAGGGLVLEGRLPAPTATEATALAYLATAVTAGAFLAWYAGLAVLGVERAGILVGLMPIATLATAAALDARLPDPFQLAGVTTVAAGLALGLTHNPEPVAAPG